MSLNYDFLVNENIPAPQFIDEYLMRESIISKKNSIDSTVHYKLYDEKGFDIYIYIVKDKIIEYEIKNKKKEHIFSECSCISFDLNKSFDYQIAKKNMINFLIFLLKKSSNDTLFIFNSDYLLFEKKDDVLYFNNETDFWQSNYEQFKISCPEVEIKIM